MEETIGLVGEGVTALIGKLTRLRGVDLDADALLRRFLDYYRTHLPIIRRPTPAWKKRSSLSRIRKKAVVSNKSEALSIRLLDSLNFLEYFDDVAAETPFPKRSLPPFRSSMCSPGLTSCPAMRSSWGTASTI